MEILFVFFSPFYMNYSKKTRSSETDIIFSEILNLEEHLNRYTGSKVTAVLLNGWILPTGRVALGKVCPAACAAGLFV